MDIISKKPPPVVLAVMFLTVRPATHIKPAVNVTQGSSAFKIPQLTLSTKLYLLQSVSHVSPIASVAQTKHHAQIV